MAIEQLDIFGGEPTRVPEPGEIPPRVYELFEKFTFEIINRGWTSYSSDAVLHRIRWHQQIDRGDREFKCNNNWTSKLSRWFMQKYPDREGFFETRERR